MKVLPQLLLLLLACVSSSVWASSSRVTTDYNDLQRQLESTLLDSYEGPVPPTEITALQDSWQRVATHLSDPEAKHLAAFTFRPSDLTASIGESRSLLNHLCVLEMLFRQKAGEIEMARLWRDQITLPKFANADDGGLLLQLPPAQARQTSVSQALAKEYLEWQVARVRQMLDRMQRELSQGKRDPAFLKENLTELLVLAHFPASLFQVSGVALPSSLPLALPELRPSAPPSAAAVALSLWRDQVEAALPNLLTADRARRLERLLARLIKLVPKEYRNGVQDGKIFIPLEYQEATQFTQQAQGLVGQLAPVWRRDQRSVYDRYHSELMNSLGDLQRQIDQVSEVGQVEAAADRVSVVLEQKFGLNARQAGSKGEVVEETALEVKNSLSSSLAAVQAGHWQEAESLRLDAYTSFDSEIEVRVLPRNPGLAYQAERSFLDGTEKDPGIKALLDQQASLTVLTRGYEKTLQNLDQCVGLLKVSVSPATVGFTSFTIIAREGLEAVIILAALLAGLKGDQQARTRQMVFWGAGAGIVLSLLTFYLSQTFIKSLIHYGEKLEAAVSVLAVLILFMVTNWVFHKVYWVEWNSRLRDLSKQARQIRAPRWEIVALLGVGCLTVYREGFETTIFMQSLLLEGGGHAVAWGVIAGFAFVGTVGTLIFFCGVKLPYRKLLVITGLLVVSIMVTFLGSTVRLFQTVNWLPIHPVPHLVFPDWVGLWLGLYPSWEGILIPPLALVYVGGAWLFTKIKFNSAPPSSPSQIIRQTLAEV